MEEFKIPPISTLSGSTIKNFFKILHKGHIEPGYYFKIILTFIIVLIATPFHIWEEFYFRRKLKKVKFEKSPLFILGHWRSGTTLLHNMLTKDPSAGYISTYQSLFPNNLASKWLFRTFMKIFMPHRRPSDGVELNISFPQEDEFAFSNLQDNAYYNFFYFPSDYKTFYEKCIRLNSLDEKEIALWFSSYEKLLKKAYLDSKGKRLIVKNPVNTARVEKILKLWPDAKFLYIYRNPVTVFHSTQRFLKQLFPTLWFHKVSDQFINNMIFDVYRQMMEDYIQQKVLIPSGNLKELRFENFEENPLIELEKIYSDLLKEDFQSVEHYFKDYLKTQKEHKKNKYLVDASEIEEIRDNLGKFIAMYNYDLPPDVMIRDSMVENRK